MIWFWGHGGIWSKIELDGFGQFFLALNILQFCITLYDKS